MSNSFEEFANNYKEGKTQLVWKWGSADLETPVSTYLKLCSDEKYSFLLESVEGGEVLGRYSAIGLRPDMLWRYDHGIAKTSVDDFSEWLDCEGEPLESLKELVKESKLEFLPDEAIPPMATSGFYGFMGYDTIRLVENIPDNNPDILNIPESILIRPTLTIIFDNVKNMMCISTPVRIHSGNSNLDAEDVYKNAINIIDDTFKILENSSVKQSVIDKTSCSLPLEISSNISRDEYHYMVRKAVEYIKAGDIFQVVPSQRFSMDFDLPPIELYRSLRRLNPSPFLFHLNFDDFALVGSSPEILVRVRDRTITIRPIAGTRKRGLNKQEDRELADDLLSDPKERAEHLMLLDLARNDVGKVSEIGSVNVTEEFTVEMYSHVMHIISNVEGTLRDDVNSIDALFSGFPAGTVSGAPKIRAMEIIDELENERRSFYAGCVGYFDGNGDVDTCITLRTALIKDNKLYVQAGGGVVSDSDAEFEYQESCNKAQAIIRAAEIAIEDFLHK
jgi:anthranilate synthase component 1